MNTAKQPLSEKKSCHALEKNWAVSQLKLPLFHLSHAVKVMSSLYLTHSHNNIATHFHLIQTQPCHFYSSNPSGKRQKTSVITYSQGLSEINHFLFLLSLFSCTDVPALSHILRQQVTVFAGTAAKSEHSVLYRDDNCLRQHVADKALDIC